MGEPIPISLGKGSNKSKFGQEGIAELVNCYFEPLGEGSKAGSAIYARNGEEDFATLTNGTGVRALLDLGSKLLAVAGRRVFEVGPGGSPATDVGGIPSDGFVTMARNNASPTQVGIVCDGQLHVYEDGDVAQSADTDLPPPVCVVAKDGYFILPIQDGRWFIAGPNTDAIDGLDFASAESQPDDNVMAAVRGPDVILFGTRSTEFWQNTGAADFPFTRSHTINVGCYAAGGVQNIMARVNERMVDSVIWPATDNQGAFAGMYILDGLTPVKISSAEVDDLIRSETDRTGIRSQAWTETSLNGQTHNFYNISGTSFSRTFDTTTGNWHARKTQGSDRWRMSCHAVFQNDHIWGGQSTNKLYRSLPSLLTDSGEELIAQWTLPTVHMFPHRFRVNGFYLDALTGVGAASATDADANPVLVIQYSKDGGISWSAPRYASIGAGGQRHVRVKERSFGMFGPHGVTFRGSCSAAVIKGVQQVALDADKLVA